MNGPDKREIGPASTRLWLRASGVVAIVRSPGPGNGFTLTSMHTTVPTLR